MKRYDFYDSLSGEPDIPDISDTGFYVSYADHLAEVERAELQLMEERDRAQDALQDTHIALGGDGEWVGRLPPQEPPDSGDLHLDVPALARKRMTELALMHELESAMTDCICDEGQSFEARAEELIVTEVAHENLKAELQRYREALKSIMNYQGTYATDKNPTIRAIKSIVSRALLAEPKEAP